MATRIDATLGGNLRAAREACGVSLLEATIRLRDQLPEALWVSLETVRRLELGVTPESKADPMLLAALAAVYGRPLSEISAVKAAELEGLSDLIRRAARSDPRNASFSEGYVGAELERAA